MSNKVVSCGVLFRFTMTKTSTEETIILHLF